MYAPHFGAALAIKGRSPGAPLWTLFVGAFIRDLVWIAFARMGIEPAQTSNFFDDWSHSLVSVAILATLFASVLGRRAQTERRSSPPATRDATKGGLWLGRSPSIHGLHRRVQRTSATVRNDTAGVDRAQRSPLRRRLHMPRHPATSQQRWPAAS